MSWPPRAPAPAPGAPAETREVIVQPREPRPDVFFLAGRVKPGYERKPAILQRRNCGSCAWFGFEHFRTDGNSRFKRPVPDLRAGEAEGVLPDQGAGLEGVRDGVLRDQLSRSDRLTARLRAAQTTVQVSPPLMSASRRSAGSPGAASPAVRSWARAWSSYVARSTCRKIPIGEVCR